MAGILIENTGHLKEILRLLGAENWDCSWLITELECYDHYGWEGSERWAGETMFLSNRDFLHDVELRDMQFVWGILSAIPAPYTQEQVLSFPLPAFSEDENGETCYLSDELRPQHPLAFLEIMSEDSTSVTVIARDIEPLRPLFRLMEWTEDAESNNRRFRQLRQIADRLVGEWGYGSMTPWMRANLYFNLWQSLYHHRPEKAVCEDEVRKLYRTYMESEKESNHA